MKLSHRVNFLCLKTMIKTKHYFVEINLRKKKWLISCSYNLHLQFIDKHLTHIGKGLDSLSSKYEDHILMGEFNAELSNNFIDSFCGSYSLKNLIKKPTCFKNPDNATCIDLILTNRQKSFQNSTIIETGLSDFHKLTVTVLKSYSKKRKPKELIHRDFKNFSNQQFRTELVKELNENTVGASQFELFQTISLGLLNKFEPLKKNTLRNNRSSFITKEVQKAIMNRLRLRNKFPNTKSQECK